MTRTFAAFLACALVACDGGPTARDVGSNTNWLQACETDAECGDDLRCRCGTCTLACDTGSDCAELGAARCAGVDDPATWATCGSREPDLASGICLPSCEPGTCAERQACVQGSCVPAAVPPGDFCAPVSERSPADRTHEDELLELVDALRTSGGALCGGTEPSAPVPALRLDARLLCASRVLAVDLAATGSLGLIDSSGRASDERLALAGYEVGVWAESFGRGSDAVGTLDAMLSEPDVCRRFVDGAYLDVGVGRAGDTSIATLASPR